jgi:outer membrane protein assembly factor BamB
MDSTPLLAGELLIASAQPQETVLESVLYALDAKTGQVQWQVPLPGQPWGNPALDPTSNDILVTTAIGQLGPVSPEDRGWSHRISFSSTQAKLKWSIPLSGMPLMRSPALEKAGLVFHILKTGELVALHTADGSLAWKKTLGGEVHASPTLVNSKSGPNLVIETLSGTLSVRDAINGDEVKKLEIPANGTSSPVFDESILYIATPGTLGAYFYE